MTPRPPQPCGDSARFRALLEGDLPEDEQAVLIEHLDSCEGCRGLLDGLSGGDGDLLDGLQRLGRTAPGLGPAAPRGVGPALDFLEPTGTPGHLGRFGPYDVLEVLGQGGMGVVLKAFDPALRRVIAIKVLDPALSSRPEARRRFLREARAAAAVSHDHVVTIHAVDEVDGMPYLVMQYVAGKSLQDRIDRSGPLGVPEALRIGMQIARGLAAAHEQGLIHRDIKPANILLENGVERVKITDFGLARAVADATLTQVGVVAGTPQYMAPEQARGEAVDQRSDLFSLGSVLYAMCTGRSPFRGDSALSVLRQVCDQVPPPIREINPEVPEWLAAIVETLHAKAPEDRYRSAAEVAELLGTHLARVAQTSGVSDPAPPAVPAKAKRWRTPALVAVLALVAATGFGAAEGFGITRVAATLATVLRIRVPEGILVITVDDPDVKVSVDGGDVVLSGGGVRELRLGAGVHRLRAERGGVSGPEELVTVMQGGRETVSVRFRPAGAGTEASAKEGGRPAVELRPPSPSGFTLEVELPAGSGFVAYSRDGRYLAAADETAGRLVLYDSRTRRPSRVCPVPGLIRSLAFAPDGKGVLSGGADGTAKLWGVAALEGREDDTATQDPMASFEGPGGLVDALAISPDGGLLALGGRHALVALWDPTRARSLSRRQLDTKGREVRRLLFSPDGNVLAAVVNGAGVLFWDVDRGEAGGEVVPVEARRFAPDRGADAISLAYAPDGHHLAVGGRTVRVWDLAGGRVARILAFPSRAESVAYSPDGRLLAAGRLDGLVTIWEVTSGRERASFQPHGGHTVLGVAFSPDGKALATACRENVARVWALPPALIATP